MAAATQQLDEEDEALLAERPMLVCIVDVNMHDLPEQAARNGAAGAAALAVREPLGRAPHAAAPACARHGVGGVSLSGSQGCPLSSSIVPNNIVNAVLSEHLTSQRSGSSLGFAERVGPGG